MQKPALHLLVGLFLLAPFTVCAGSNATLPSVVPADFPFPEGASLNVTTQQLASGKQTVVSFSFTQDAGALYGRIRRYAVEKGYDIPVESKTGGQLTARKSPADSFVLNIQDMGVVKVATVSFFEAGK